MGNLNTKIKLLCYLATIVFMGDGCKKDNIQNDQYYPIRVVLNQPEFVGTISKVEFYSQLDANKAEFIHYNIKHNSDNISIDTTIMLKLQSKIFIIASSILKKEDKYSEIKNVKEKGYEIQYDVSLQIYKGNSIPININSKKINLTYIVQ